MQNDTEVLPEDPIEEIIYTANNCLDGKDLNADDVDISKCPEIPLAPDYVSTDWAGSISLGMWEKEWKLNQPVSIKECVEISEFERI